LQVAPDLGGSVSSEVIKGLVSVNEKMVILLDIDELLTLEDIPNLNTLKETLDVQSA
jgi:purine-binding chemotaxis protein CheW